MQCRLGGAKIRPLQQSALCNTLLLLLPTRLQLRGSPPALNNLLLSPIPSSQLRALHCTPPFLAPKGKSSKAAATRTAPSPSSSSESVADESNDTADLNAALGRYIDALSREFSKLRGASASPNMLDHVVVEAYGERQPLAGVAQISQRNPTLLVVSPFDASMAPAIAEAIRNANLNLNPSAEAGTVRVPVPKASKESRDATSKAVSKLAEGTKSKIRRLRQAAMEKFKKADGAWTLPVSKTQSFYVDITSRGATMLTDPFFGSRDLPLLAGVSEDDVFRETKELQLLIDAAVEKVSAMMDKKRAEVESA